MNVYNRSLLTIRGASAWIEAMIGGREVIYLQVESIPLDFWPDEILNQKQFEIYKAIVDYKVQHGYAPTYAELVEITGRAIATVQKRIKEISALGLIEYHGGRAITVQGETYIKPLPMFYIEEHPERVQAVK